MAVHIDCASRSGLIAAIVQTQGRYQLRVLDKEGKNERILVEGRDAILDARWTHIGNSLVYLVATENGEKLYKIFVKPEATPALLLNLPDANTDSIDVPHISISEDGTRLAYTRTRGFSNLWGAPLAGSGNVEIKQFTTGTFGYRSPVFSPDGKWLAFSRGSGTVFTNIYKMQSNGGDPTQLTYFDEGTIGDVAWSPDGTKVAFVRDSGGKAKVWIVPAEGGPSKSLDTTDASDSNLALSWAPRREISYQTGGNQNFQRLDPESGSQEPLIAPSQIEGWLVTRPVFSGGANQFAITWSSGEQPGLGLITLKPFSRTILKSGFVVPFGWSADNRQIYAEQSNKDTTDILVVDLKSPYRSRVLFSIPKRGENFYFSGFPPALSPDGHNIVFTIPEANSDIWLVKDFDPDANTDRRPN